MLFSTLVSRMVIGMDDEGREAGVEAGGEWTRETRGGELERRRRVPKEKRAARRTEETRFLDNLAYLEAFTRAKAEKCKTEGRKEKPPTMQPPQHL